MLLNHPIDYLYRVCVCVRRVVQRVTDCQGEPSRYMLMGPCVSKAEYSFIRLYYAKQYTPAVAQARTNLHTPTLCTICGPNVPEVHTNTSHKARGEQRAPGPVRLRGWGVLLSDTHLGWGWLSPVWAQTAGTDDRGWVNIFILKGQDRPDWTSLFLSAFTSVST